MYLSGAHSGGMHATRARKRSLPHCYTKHVHACTLQALCMHGASGKNVLLYAAQNSRKSPSLVVE